MKIQYYVWNKIGITTKITLEGDMDTIEKIIETIKELSKKQEWKLG